MATIVKVSSEPSGRFELFGDGSRVMGQAQAVQSSHFSLLWCRRLKLSLKFNPLNCFAAAPGNLQTGSNLPLLRQSGATYGSLRSS